MCIRVRGYLIVCVFFFFFFNDTATTEIYTLSLHDALPISLLQKRGGLLNKETFTRPVPPNQLAVRPQLG